MAYIANRPVRFDRDYAIGEIIPESVIDPKMTTKLTSMGRIIKVADAQTKQETQETTAEDAETAAEDESDGAECEKFICEECGKGFKSKNALAAHSKTHKK